MKKALTLLLILASLFSIAACGGPSDDEIKAVRNVSFEGTELTVTLGTNKSTGYEWDYKIYGDCIQPSINRSFKVTGSNGDATGEVSIGFEGVSEGDATIVLATSNGWDGVGAGDGYTVTVAVGADGTIKSAEGKAGADYPQAMPEPTATPVPEPKTTIAIAEILESTYTGTLSGDSYTTDEDAYSISPDISPAEITVTFKDGQVALYAAASVSASGVVFGVDSPRSPTYIQTVSGSLPLSQVDANTVRAEGDLTTEGEGVWIYWDENKKFTKWDIEKKENTYRCLVSITMLGGVPTAEIIVDGSSSHRTSIVPLALAAQGAQSTAETIGDA